MRALATLALLLALLAPPAAAQFLPAEPEPAAEAPDAAEAARLLADVIEDPEARARLVAQLRASAEGTEPAAADTEPSLARAVADRTLGLAEAVSGGVIGLADALRDLRGLRAGFAAIDWVEIAEAVFAVAVVALATIGMFVVLRRLTGGIPGRIAARFEGAGWLRKLIGLVLLALLQLVLLALAWSAGHALALAVGGSDASLRQGLFLNAFLVTELAKLVLRLLLAPRRTELRLPPISDAAATEWYSRPARILSVLGYGLLLAVPIAREEISLRAADWVETATVLLAAWMAVSLILANRRPVADALHAAASRRGETLLGRALGALARTWHLVALAYLVGLLVVWVTRPADALGFMVAATLRSALALGVGAMLLAAIDRLTRGIALPEDAKSRLPSLEPRLNGILPLLGRVLRVVVALGVLAAILDAWSILDLGGWLAAGPGRALVQNLLAAAIILVAAVLAWLAVSSWIELKLNPTGEALVTARERTLLSLLRNAFTIVVVVIAGMLALSAFGVNIAPLIAGAGVVGLAVGFGSQKLVQDIITGAFIQFENAMNTGDVVTAGGISGVVEKLTIRSVGLRSLDGSYHLIPFSSVDTVSNTMKDFSYHVAEIGVAYREDIDEVKAVMQRAFDALRASDLGADIIGPLDMQGLVTFGDSAVLVRARIMTLPGKQWSIGRRYNEILKHAFDEAGIEMPFPHLTIYMGQDKAGASPPLNLRPVSDALPPSQPEAPGQG